MPQPEKPVAPAASQQTTYIVNPSTDVFHRGSCGHAKRSNAANRAEMSAANGEEMEAWVAQYSYGRRPDGARYRKTLYGKVRKKVKENLETFATFANSGTVSTGTPTSPRVRMDTRLFETKIKKDF